MMKKLLILLVMALAAPSFAATQVVLHGTAAEIAEWKKRAGIDPVVSPAPGPYASEYTAIKSRADAFVAGTDATAWSGNTNSSCWLGEPAPGNNRAKHEGARDAGFVYLLTGTTSYSDAVRTLLLAQAAVSGTDFSNTTKWCATSEMNNVIELSPWLRRLAYAYSYTKSTFSGAQQATMDAWFLNAANYLYTKMDLRVKACFPNYASDDWTNTCGTSNVNLTHYNGYNVKTGSGVFQNQESVGISGLAALAVLLNDTTLKAAAVRFVKGWLRVAVFPDGTVADQFRWIQLKSSPGHPGSGYNYASVTIGSMVSAADHLQRAGESIYDYSTSEGVTGHETIGGPKSIGLAVKRMAQLQQHLVDAYGSEDATLTDCERIDDFVDTTVAGCTQFAATGGSVRIVQDMAPMAISNIFYKDSTVATSYSRAAHSSPSCGWNYCMAGDWSNYPSARFMFGGMENISDAFDPVTPPGETPTINVASASSIEDANASTWAVTLASPCASGNLYLMLVASDFHGTITFPIGTDLDTTLCPGSVCQFDSAYHTSTGAEGSSIDVTTSANDRSAHQTFCLSSQHASSAPEISVTTGTSTSADPPSITPSWGSGDETTLFISGFMTNAGVTTSAAPTGYSNLTSADSGGSTQGVVLVTSRKHTASASEDPAAYTLSTSSPWVAFTIAVRPQELDPQTYTLTQSRYRFYGYYNTSESSPTALAAENTDISVAPQAKLLLRMKARGNIVDPPSVNLQLRYSRNGGAYTALTDTFANGIKFAGPHADAVVDGTATTELLTSDETDNVAGRIALTANAITWNPTLDSEGEFVFGLAFDSSTAAVGDTYDFRLYQEDGTAFDTYTTTPRITIIPNSGGTGF